MKPCMQTAGYNNIALGPCIFEDAVEVSTLHKILTGVTNTVPQSYLDHTGSNVLFLSIYVKGDIFALERVRCKVI